MVAWHDPMEESTLIITSYAEWQEWSASYHHLPFVARYPLSDVRIASWERAWSLDKGTGAVVLESGKGGRYTLFAAEPTATIRGKNMHADIVIYENGIEYAAQVEAPPLKAVQQWMAPYRTPFVAGAPKFIGGCIGYWSYDVARSIERLPNLANDDLQLPDYYWMRFDRVWIVDHQAGHLYCSIHQKVDSEDKGRLPELYSQAEEKVKAMKLEWDRIAGSGSSGTSDVDRRQEAFRRMTEEAGHDIDLEGRSDISPSLSKEEFVQAVLAVQRYISAGDVFQVNLSVRQSAPLDEDLQPEDIYEWLRLLNPSPYMGLLRFPGLTLVSGSPELLVKYEQGRLETRPIAGTRPRGGSAEEDRRLADELINHEKERAEHIMLVDLLRNDLGRVSTYGTVKVDELMTIEYYSHVMHIVSHVSGKLAEGRDAYDVIAAVFPGGTITGAPKIRTMEIIEELEPVRRGPYTGSIGWIDYNGNMELNITIRTMVVHEGMCHIQAGAGIVIDSIPEREYTEALNKAKALWKAMEYARMGKATIQGREPR
jgi:para-aminobenzoate synthetase component I